MARPKTKTSNRRRSRSVEVDMSGVESGGRSVPDGTYTAEIESVEQSEAKSSGEPMLVVKWRITSKKGKGTLLYDNLSLQPQALWRLKTLLEALEIEVPDSSMEIEFDELEGKELTIQVTNETYEGKERSRITNYLGEGDQDGEEDEDEDEEEEPPRKPRGRPRSRPDDDEDEDTDEDAEDEDERADNKSQHKGALKKLKKGASVRFKDEKGKRVNGTVVKIDGDVVTVEDEDEETWEVETSEVTVVG